MKPNEPIDNWEAAWDYLEDLREAPKSDDDFGVKIYLDVPTSLSGSGQWFTLWCPDRDQLIEMLRNAWLFIWETYTGEYPVELQPGLNSALVGHKHLSNEEVKSIFNKHTAVAAIDWLCTFHELKHSSEDWAVEERDWIASCMGLSPNDAGWNDACKEFLTNMGY